MAFGTAALAAPQPPQPQPNQELAELRRSVDDLRRSIQPEKKDTWDKLSSISGLVTGVLVALIGATATYLYNERQRTTQAADRARELRVMEVQTIASFLPHLQASDPQGREAALVAMSALGNTELAARLATIYRDEASLAALTRIASGGDREAASVAEQSLDELLRSAVVQVGNHDRPLIATGFAVAPGLIVTADYAVEGIASPVITSFDGTSRDAQILGRDSTHGIALISVGNVELVPLRLQEEPVTLDTAGDLTMLGSSPTGWRMSVGRLEGREFTVPTLAPDVNWLQATIESEPGNGGAPVVNRSGSVVAMVYAAGQVPGTELLLPAEAIDAGLTELRAPIGYKRHAVPIGGARGFWSAANTRGGVALAGGHVAITDEYLSFSPWDLDGTRKWLFNVLGKASAPAWVGNIDDLITRGRVHEPVAIPISAIREVNVLNRASMLKPPTARISFDGRQFDLGIVSAPRSPNFSGSNNEAFEHFLRVLEEVRQGAPETAG
jgi:hypothetical protein